MAPKYKLTYFNFTGRGEPIRLLLAYGGIPFEDKRFEMEEWPKVKPDTPLGQVPVLEIDGKPFTQTVPLCRYIANVNNIDGKNALENLAIDIVIEIFWDLLKTAYDLMFEAEEAKKTKLKEKLDGQLTVLLGKLEEDTKKNGGYLALNRISWADVVFLHCYEDLTNIIPEEKPFSKYPNLEKLKNKLLQNKNIKDYIQKRPINKMMTKYSLKNDL